MVDILEVSIFHDQPKPVIAKRKKSTRMKALEKKMTVKTTKTQPTLRTRVRGHHMPRRASCETL